jgi:6-phosphofructokinase 1
MVALQGQNVTSVPLADAISELKRVTMDMDLVMSARQLGISFGD